MILLDNIFKATGSSGRIVDGVLCLHLHTRFVVRVVILWCKSISVFASTCTRIRFFVTLSKTILDVKPGDRNGSKHDVYQSGRIQPDICIQGGSNGRWKSTRNGVAVVSYCIVSYYIIMEQSIEKDSERGVFWFGFCVHRSHTLHYTEWNPIHTQGEFNPTQSDHQ